MLVKPEILRGDERLPRVQGNLLQRDDGSVFRTAQLAHQIAVRVVEAGRLRKRVQAGVVKPLPMRHVKNQKKRRRQHNQRAQQRTDGNSYPFLLFAHRHSLHLRA